MKSFAWYDLQVIICSAIMMLYYFMVLRNKKFHQYNRFYILAVFFLSFLIPLIKIQLDKMETQKAVVQFIYVLADYNAVMDKAVAAKGFQVNWDMMAIAAYAAISAFFLTTFIVALLRIRHLLKKYSCNNLGDVYLILTNVKGTPFSFFRYIFWNEEIDLQSSTGQQILQHELTHVKEKHSIDNVIVQVMMVAGWFNPFFWIARKELKMIHEFIADKRSVESGDAASLAEMLLTATYPQQQFLLTNSFFFSPIKRRLLMITNNKNPRFSYMRRLVVLPLMAIVVLLFAFRMKQENKQTDNSNNVTLNNSYIVVIDPGHGGENKGAVAPDGTTESELNLQFAIALKEQNNNRNISIISTRESDRDMSQEGRAGFAKDEHADIFISLHCNEVAPPIGKVDEHHLSEKFSGTEIFIASNNGVSNYEENHSLANNLGNSILEVNHNFKGIKTRMGAKIFVLEKLQCPSALIELGFLTNNRELQKLKDAEYRKNIANAILSGIANFLKQKEEGTQNSALYFNSDTIQNPSGAGVTQAQMDEYEALVKKVSREEMMKNVRTTYLIDDTKIKEMKRIVEIRQSMNDLQKEKENMNII